MPGRPLKTLAKAVPVELGSHHHTIQKLICEGFFDSPASSEEVARRVTEKSGNRLKTIHVQTYLKKFLAADILQAIRPDGSRQNFWVLTSVARSDALASIGKGKKVREIQEELRDNFGKHGNSTAFLLRKILEKLLIIVFAKNGKENLLEDPARPGGWKGLKDMIETAAREKHSGVPFLTHKTAGETKGLKFLGDTAAHNPKVSVPMSSIVPQMPFMII